MQEPNALVAPQLLPHLHLISSSRYPQLFKVEYTQIFEFLRTAPSLIGELKPVSWTYLAPPPPAGTLLLEWMSPSRSPAQFSSDGYAWVDMEQITRVEVEGYIMEIFFHVSGFNPEVKNTHLVSRYRFRLLSKANPNVPGDDPDPALWIIQYCRSDAPPSIPNNFFATRPDVHQLLQERKTIERLGVLSRKEFMFKDRSNWPSLPFPNPNVPGGQMPPGSAHPQHPGAAGQPNVMSQPHPGVAAQYFQAAQGAPVAPHPAAIKRTRPGQPTEGGAAQPGLSVPSDPVRPEGQQDEASTIHLAQQIAADTLREEEENAVLGDALDHLTPRDISLMRYMRHHDWMDEVLNSPFSSLNILPVDLGLGLAGALEPLTDGLLFSPGAKTVEPVAMPRRNGPMVMVVPPIPIVKKIDQQTLQEVEGRVKQFVNDGEDELRSLRQAHAKRMADLRKTRVYARAEKRLRDVYNGEADELKNPTLTVDASGHGDARFANPYDLVEETAQAVERVMKIRIVPKDKIELVSRGGLIVGDPNEGFRSEREKAALVAASNPSQISGHGSTAVSTPLLDTSMMSDVDPQLHSTSAVVSHSGMSIGGAVPSRESSQLQSSLDGSGPNSAGLS